MNQNNPPLALVEFSKLPIDEGDRHMAFVDLFGGWVFWLRNWSLEASRRMIESEEDRQELGTIRRKYFELAAGLPPEQRDAALMLAQQTLDEFLERLTWCLGDQGTDCLFDGRNAYRFRIDVEIVDVDSGVVVEEHAINRGGRFFGKHWGRWLNQFGRSSAS